MLYWLRTFFDVKILFPDKPEKVATVFLLQEETKTTVLLKILVNILSQKVQQDLFKLIGIKEISCP
jgi:hypothetical protein